MDYFWESNKKADLKLYNAKNYKCNKVKLKLGCAYYNPDEYEKSYFSGIIYKGWHNTGFLKDFQPIYYDKKMGKIISRLFAIQVYYKYRRKNIAADAISGLVEIIKENYGLSNGLKLDSIMTSAGEKAFLKIAQRLEAENIISGYEVCMDAEIISDYEIDDCNKDNFIFLKF